MKIILALLFGVFSALCGEILVITHPDNPVDSLAQEEVSHLFLGKNPHFPDGSKAVPLEWSNQKNKAKFYQQLSGKTLSQLRAYWAAFLFTGKGRPPKQVAYIDEIMKSIMTNKHAVTYLDATLVNDHVKILYRLR